MFVKENPDRKKKIENNVKGTTQIRHFIFFPHPPSLLFKKGAPLFAPVKTYEINEAMTN